jgi:anti-anti-sigma factor
MHMSEHAQRGWSLRRKRIRPVSGRRSPAPHHPFSGLFAGPETGLPIHCVDDGATHLVAPTGKLDRTSAWILERALRRAEATDAREIVLDLGGLELIDPIGVQIVVQADARARVHGKQLVIRRGPASVHRMFELSGLTHRLPFAEFAGGIPLP